MTTTGAERTERTERARPLSPDDRRAAILDAVIPLIAEHGRDVTSRQLAEAAGVAEGTIFRAFGDKDSLIKAAVAKYLDPLALAATLRAIDLDLPLEEKLRAILGALQNRFHGVFGMMSAVGMTSRPPVGDTRSYYASVVADILAPNRDELAVPPETVARFIRIIAFSTSIPQFAENGPVELDQLAKLIHTGVAGRE